MMKIIDVKVGDLYDLRDDDSFGTFKLIALECRIKEPNAVVSSEKYGVDIDDGRCLLTIQELIEKEGEIVLYIEKLKYSKDVDVKKYNQLSIWFGEEEHIVLGFKTMSRYIMCRVN